MGDAANIRIAEINAQAALNQAQIAADASRFGTKTAAGASMYGADQGLAGSNVAANASMYGADKQAASAAAQTSAFRDVSAMRDAGETRRNQATIDAGIVNTGITNAPYSQSSTNAMDTASQRYTAPRMGYLSGSNTSPSASSLTPRVSGGGDNSLTKGMSEGTFELDGASRRFSKGTAKVPGQGDGTVDTVDAKLAPGEAVLNKAAAEMLGRGLIDLLNKHGMLQMGMPDPKEEADEGEPGYSCGTSNVRHYATGTPFVSEFDAPNEGESAVETAARALPMYNLGTEVPFLSGMGTIRSNFNAPATPPALRQNRGNPMPDAGRQFAPAGNIAGGMPEQRRNIAPAAGSGPVTPLDSRSEVKFEQPLGFADERPLNQVPPVRPVAPVPQAAPMGASHLAPPPAAGFQPAPQPPVQMGGPQFGVAPERPVNLAPAPPPRMINGMTGAAPQSIPPQGQRPTMPAPAPSPINNNMSFDQAFKTARDAFGGAGGQFSWHGKDYQTNVKGEAYSKAPKPVF